MCVFSQSEQGLQNAIDKVVLFYSSLGLQLSSKKTKVLIFNKSGKVLKGHSFLINGAQLEVTDSYQYLGIKLRPSGSFTTATEVLSDKARKAWFSLSKIVYKDKKISVDRAFNLFDSLVSPVALYGCEMWYPHILPKKCVQDKSKLLSFWEDFKCEKINQLCARVLLSVHRKASRLAVLGELGRYPMSVRAMSHTLNYRLCLASKPENSLIGHTMTEMKKMSKSNQDCWLARTDKMAKLLSVPDVRYGQSSGRQLLKYVQGKFDMFWLSEIKSSKLDKDGVEHNKLLTYSSFKAQFSMEPYLALVQNRNQRCQLSRLRVSAHRLGIELLRYCRPPVPRNRRFCKYCPPEKGPTGQIVGPVDDECHFVTSCTVGQTDRAEVYKEVSSGKSTFMELCSVDKFKTLVCPITPFDCKIVNRFLENQFKRRDEIDIGILK